MKRFHVHVSVKEMQEGVRFYSAMFGQQPTVLKDDYAKWMLDDPRVNFAISNRITKTGVDHLGIQVESAEELSGVEADLHRASDAVQAGSGAPCCYAQSDKYWVQDPAGIAWEAFHTLGSVPVFGEDHSPSGPATKATCCAPLLGKTNCC